MHLIADAHQDLAWNMLCFGRDYTRSAHETRLLEAGSIAVEQNGDSTIGWPEYQAGRVAVIFATLFASPARFVTGAWDTVFYRDRDYEGAHRIYQKQLDLYERLTDALPHKFSPIASRADLKRILDHWQSTPPGPAAGHPVGLVYLMEGAEGIRSPHELPQWYERGLRHIGLAWAGTRYCGGTKEPGPLTDEGRALLKAMADFNFTLDLSHMDETAALEALDLYPGPIIATHANCLALLPGFGLQSIPHEMDTIVDLHKLADFLEPRGYSDSDLAAILGGNWLRHLNENLP